MSRLPVLLGLLLACGQDEPEPEAPRPLMVYWSAQSLKRAAQALGLGEGSCQRTMGKLDGCFLQAEHAAFGLELQHLGNTDIAGITANDWRQAGKAVKLDHNDVLGVTVFDTQRATQLGDGLTASLTRLRELSADRLFERVKADFPAAQCTQGEHGGRQRMHCQVDDADTTGWVKLSVSPEPSPSDFDNIRVLGSWQRTQSDAELEIRLIDKAASKEVLGKLLKELAGEG